MTDDVEAYLRSLGATDAQIADAREHDRLAGLAADLRLVGDEQLSLEELARRCGTTSAVVTRLFGQLGIRLDGAEEVLSPDDEELVTTFLAGEALGLLPIDELLRVTGAVAARLADASVTTYVRTVEGDLAVGGATPTEQARSARAGADLGLALGRVLGRVFVHHLRQAVGWQRTSMAGLPGHATARLAVGFVDLVGFTPMARRLSTDELGELVSGVERSAFEVVTHSGGRVIKHIGDEVMFAATSVDQACATALELVAAFTIDGVEPRGGLCFGEVLTRHGDLYGSVVNLAARLTQLAVPGEVLVDDGVVAGSQGATTFEAAGRRIVKGFDDPVRVHTVVAVGA